MRKKIQQDFNLKLIKQIFWNGLKAFVPIVITLAIVFWIGEGIEHFFKILLLLILPKKYYFQGLGIIAGVVFIFILGFLVKSWTIRPIYAMAQRTLKRIPVIKTIYNAVEDLLNFFDKSRVGQQAVMITTPVGNVVGFVTRDSLPSLTPPLGSSDEVLVYIPFSYIIGGVTMVVSREAITPLDWPVDKAMSFIITAGMGGSKVMEK